MLYSELVKEMEDRPSSQLPGLFVAIVRECIKREVFNPGGLEFTIKRVQEEKNHE